MKNKKKVNTPRSDQKKEKVITPELTLSPAKKRVFWVITILIPVLLFLVLEIGLRIFNYGGNLDLFIEGPAGYEEYLRCNPEVARRYFTTQSNVPTPPKQLFLKQKPKNGYRIFVLGESSAAGFPYSNNASFPNILERALAQTFPGKRIEVINVAMAAINSYTLLDFIDEICEQSPDALLIYTGHNEYYGALGVGSTQSLGNSRWLIRSYLKLRSIKTFMLLRNIVDWISIQISNLFFEGSEINPSATLMENVVAEQTIPYGSVLYEEGKRQFKENIESILSKAREKGLKVILGELVSNLRDQKPFISVNDKTGNSAKSFFDLARQAEANGEFEKAKQYYVKAKDYDALRFRAPEDFNIILNELAQKYSAPLVPTVSYFVNESPNGLIGDNLMLEHLHPNMNGYYLLAKAFYETMENENLIERTWQIDGILEQINIGVTELDSTYGALAVQQLKSGWPFQPKSLPNRFMQSFRPSNYIEEVAFRVLQGNNFSLEAGHIELGRYYEKQGEFDKAFAEYNALVTSIPTEIEFYERAVTVLLKEKNYDKALHLLQKSLRYKQSAFANKWIGQISYISNNYKEAVSFLLKADLNDPQVLFNLSRSYYSDDQWNYGEIYYKRLQNIAPQSEYFSYLTKLRTLTQIKGSKPKIN